MVPPPPRRSRHGLYSADSSLSLPPIEDLHISVPAYECTVVGRVSNIVDEVVVVWADPGTPAVDEETVLFLEQGSRPLGKVSVAIFVFQYSGLIGTIRRMINECIIFHFIQVLWRHIL